MTIQINERTSAEIYIEDRELVLNNGNVLHVLHIVASSRLALPEFYLEFSDALGLVPKLSLRDNSLVTIVINGGTKMVRRFRISTWSTTSIGTGLRYRIEGYWAAPRYMTTTTWAPILQSSSNALRKIATDCGLLWGANAVTADTMNWIPGNRTYVAFAREIARHGYMDTRSHLVLGVDSRGTMVYRNVNQNPKPVANVAFTKAGQSNFVQCIDFTPLVNSGTSNYLGGYRHKRYVQSVAASKTIEGLNFESDSRVPLINSGVRDATARNFVSYGPIDFGNLHPDYDAARYQNTRFNLLNSLRAEFLFGFQTSFEMCDNFNYTNVSDLRNTQYDGEYTVLSKIIFVAGTDYHEKITAVKNGLSS